MEFWTFEIHHTGIPLSNTCEKLKKKKQWKQNLNSALLKQLTEIRIVYSGLINQLYPYQ